MAPFQCMGMGWTPVRHLLYLAGHLYVLKDQGKDGSKELPRGDYRRKAHEKWDRRRDLKEEREIISGTGTHSLFQRGNDEKRLWEPVIFQKEPSHAMVEVLPAHRGQKELSDDQTSFSLWAMHFGDSGRGVAEMSKQLLVNSK